MLRRWLPAVMFMACGWGAADAVADAAVAPSARAADLVPARPDLTPIQSGVDYHSFANVEQFRVTHLELDLRVDPFFKTLRGVAALKVKRLDPNATELILDTRDLNISDVTVKAQDVLGATSPGETTWVSRPFHFERKDPILGQALVIDLPPSQRSTVLVRIDYETSPTAPALQWLTARQNGNRHTGFFFTQSEPIGARSWIPLQDTPLVRMTYSATIHTSPGVLAVMSAKNDPKARRNGIYTFDMPDPIPSYLIALAVGDLTFRETGPRTGVYADKAVIKEAAREFADSESMLETAEKLFGPYRFGRYDILVMPPSFPVGGMENPRVAFITPTVLAGDKSLVSVIAHELAHSWAGNLVGNASWRDLWLNEGFADYLESRIINAVYGERHEMMDRVLGLEELNQDLATLKPADQVLAIDLRERDPDAVFSTVPYEKGRLFLTYLDAKFGREHFDAFLRGYFDHFAFQSITTEQFEAYLQANLLDRYPGIVTRDQVLAWITAPGLPADAVLPVSGEFAPVDAARAAWLGGSLPAKALKTDSGGWMTQQWVYFLDNMPAGLTGAQLAELDRTFAFTKTANAEIGRSWFLLVIRHQYQPGYARLETYLQTIGRRRLITPLYEELMKTPGGTAQARRVYALARPGYHPETASAIDAIVNAKPEDADE
jgi:aminopeptidase N